MKRSIVILTHIIFWLIFISFSFYRIKEWNSISPAIKLDGLISTLFFVAIFYSFYFVFLPHYLANHQFLKFIIVTFSMVIAVASIYYLLYNGFARLNGTWSVSAFESLLTTIIWGAISSFIRLVFEWVNTSIYQKELKIQNFKSELKLLKYQLNPHFLFNTLNNIDALIYENPDNASLALSKLSEIMRYVVYKSETDKVPLNEELNYIENYLSLQRLRTIHEKAIFFKVEGESNNKKIAPMVFIPFIENAFKHASLKGKKSIIDIFLQINNDNIEFQCRNSFNETSNKDKTRGIGLEVIRKRLDLIYPGKYQLNIDKNSDVFQVNLNIAL